jgi:hypothetical protein
VNIDGENIDSINALLGLIDDERKKRLESESRLNSLEKDLISLKKTFGSSLVDIAKKYSGDIPKFSAPLIVSSKEKKNKTSKKKKNYNTTYLISRNSKLEKKGIEIIQTTDKNAVIKGLTIKDAFSKMGISLEPADTRRISFLIRSYIKKDPIQIIQSGTKSMGKFLYNMEVFRVLRDRTKDCYNFIANTDGFKKAPFEEQLRLKNIFNNITPENIKRLRAYLPNDFF